MRGGRGCAGEKRGAACFTWQPSGDAACPGLAPARAGAPALTPGPAAAAAAGAISCSAPKHCSNSAQEMVPLASRRKQRSTLVASGPPMAGSPAARHSTSSTCSRGMCSPAGSCNHVVEGGWDEAAAAAADCGRLRGGCFLAGWAGARLQLLQDAYLASGALQEGLVQGLERQRAKVKGLRGRRCHVRYLNVLKCQWRIVQRPGREQQGSSEAGKMAS